MKISVIIPVYNGARTLDTCLKALFTGTRRPDECLVADDGSTDDSAAIAARHGATVLRVGEAPVGPAMARNHAALQASGDIFVFIDADVAVHSDTLERFEAVFADSAVVAAFGSYDDNPPLPGIVSRYKNLVHHYVHQQGKKEAATFWAGCGAVRGDIFHAHGGFSSRYPTPSIEDIELGVRLRRAGHRIRLCPEVQCTHHKQWTLFSWLRTDIFQRAVPWSRLILSTGDLPRDLNLDNRSRFSALLAWAALLGLAGSLLHPISLAIAAIALILWGTLQADILRFFTRRGGVGFAVGAGGLHLIYFLYASGTFGAVLLHHLSRRAAPFLFFVCLFALTSNGRVSNLDTGSQLESATHLAMYGTLASVERPGPQWVQGPNGLWYEWHDLGSQLLLTPAGAIGRLRSGSVSHPSLPARLSVAVTYVFVSAVGAAALLGLLSFWYSRRAAFLLTLLFVGGSLYLPYAKSCFDVQAAAAFVALTLYAAIGWERQPTRRNALLTGLCAATVCLLRYSFAPFFLVGLLLYLWGRRSHLPRTQILLCLIPITLAVGADFVFNAIRSGVPWSPPSTGTVPALSRLKGDWGVGLYGLLFSLNFGLFVSAPLFLVLLATPFLNSRWPDEARRLFFTFGSGGLLYMLMLARLTFWGTFGWGPRYLVPLLPIGFVGVAAILVAVPKSLRGIPATLAGFSCLLSMPPTLVNWTLIFAMDLNTLLRFPPLPYQHLTTWEGFIRGIQGYPLSAPEYVLQDPVRRLQIYFPDLWMTYGIRRGGIAASLTIGITLFLLWGIWRNYQQISTKVNDHQESDSETAEATPTR